LVSYSELRERKKMADLQVNRLRPEDLRLEEPTFTPRYTTQVTQPSIPAKQTQKEPLLRRILNASDDFQENFVDSVTFGLSGLAKKGLYNLTGSEYLKPKETDSFAGKAGEFAGYVLPGTIIESGVSAVAKPLIKNLPKWKQLATTGAASGAIEAAAQEGADVAFRGETFDPLNIAIGAGAGGAIGAVIPSVEKLFRNLNRRPITPEILSPGGTRTVGPQLALPSAPSPTPVVRGNINRAETPDVIYQAGGKPELFGLPEPKVAPPTTARIARQPNVMRQKVEAFAKQMENVPMSPGREYEELLEAWGRFASREDPDLETAIELAYPTRANRVTPDLMQQARSNQAAREVAGVDLPVRSMSDRYQGGVMAPAAAPQTTVATPNYQAIREARQAQMQAKMPPQMPEPSFPPVRQDTIDIQPQKKSEIDEQEQPIQDFYVTVPQPVKVRTQAQQPIQQPINAQPQPQVPTQPARQPQTLTEEVFDTPDTIQPPDTIQTPDAIQPPTTTRTQKPTTNVGVNQNRKNIQTSSGQRIDIEYELIEADDLIASNDPITLKKNPNYDQSLQPRDRDKTTYEFQIQDILNENKFNPDRLVDSSTTDTGAPIVFGSMVESGNGRTMALQRGYLTNHPSAQVYRDYLNNNAGQFGFTPEQVATMKNPILVRVRKTNLSQKQKDLYLKESNESTSASLGATEQAKLDSRIIDDRISSLIDDEGNIDLTSPSNKNFVISFLQNVVAKNELNRYIDSNNMINQEGITRIRNAIYAKAYENEQAIARMVESTDDNVKNVSQALLNFAPRLIKLKAAIKNGELHDADVSKDLVNALIRFSDIKRQKQTVEGFLKQVSVFDDITDVEKSLLVLFDQMNRKKQKLTNLFNSYADVLETFGDPNQATLFGDIEAPTKLEILSAATKLENEKGEMLDADLFTFRDGEGGSGQQTVRDDTPAQTTGTLESQNQTTVEQPKPAKDDWEITQKDFVDQRLYNQIVVNQSARQTNEKRKFIELVHKDAVRKAIAEGKTIPPEVLKDYPDLQQLAIKSAATQQPEIEQPKPAAKGIVKEITSEKPQLQQKLDIDATISEIEEIVQEVQQPRIRDRVIQSLDEAEQAARKRIASRKNQLSSNPVDQYADYAIIMAAKIGKGAIKAADFTEELVKEFGEQIRPQAERIFRQTREILRTQERKATSEGKAAEAFNNSGQGNASSFAAKINRQGSKKKIPFAQRWEKLRAQTVDDLAALEGLEKRIKGRVSSAEDSLYKTARLFKGTPEKANQIVRERLSAVVKQIEDIGFTTDELGDYALARHAKDVNAAGYKSGFTNAEIDDVLKKYGTPEMESARKALVQINRDMLRELVKSDVISRELADVLNNRWQNYIPLFRSFDDEKIEFAGGLSQALANVTNPIKVLKGSERQVIDPLENMVKNIFQSVNAAERNKVALQLAKLADEDENSDFIRKLGPDEKVGRKNVVGVKINGETVKYEVEQEVYKAILNLDQESSNVLINILSKPASLLRAGATLTPEFSLRNPIRDILQAYATSNSGFNPITDFTAGLIQAIKKGNLYKQWVNNLGAYGNVISLDRDLYRKSLENVLKESPGKKFVNIISGKSLIELLRAISDVSESATKIGEFRAALRQGQSIKEAAYRSRDIMDFARSGSSIRQANRIVAFLNANIQGKSKLIRAIQNDPIGTTTRMFKAVTLPTIGIIASNHYLANENQKKTISDAPDWMKDSFWLVAVPGTDVVARIPKPFDIAPLFANLPEKAIQFVKDNDPDAFDGFVRRSLSDAALPFQISGLVPIVEGMTNYSFFRGNQIVPMGEEFREFKDQFDPMRTTETAKVLAAGMSKITGEQGPFKNFSSPRIMDNTIRGFTAGLGSYATSFIDTILKSSGAIDRPESAEKRLEQLPLAKAFLVDPFQNTKSLDKFYDEREKLQKQKTSAKLNNTLFKDEARLKYLNKVADNMSKINSNIRSIESGEFSPTEKRERIESLLMTKLELARKAAKTGGTGGK
jgi:hypothetical protein